MKAQFKGEKILVVGGAGFIGSNLVKKLLEYEVQKIHIIDNLLSSEKDNIPHDNRVLFQKGSIADDRVLNNLKDQYKYIFHLATYHGNQSSIHNPLSDHQNNLLTTLKLFDHLKYFKKIKKLVYASAGCAVALKKARKVKATKEVDSVSLDQDSPYSISKIVGEFYCKYYFKQHKLPTVRARFQNVYGPGEILGAGKWRGTPATIWRNVIPTFVYKAIKSESLTINGKGIATRDFIFVEDLVKGLILCAVKGKPGDVYNLASGKQTSILHLAKLINTLTENPVPIKLMPQRIWDTSIARYGSTVKSKKELNFISKVDLQKGLNKTITWTENNLKLIERNITKHSEYPNVENKN